MFMVFNISNLPKQILINKITYHPSRILGQYGRALIQGT